MALRIMSAVFCVTDWLAELEVTLRPGLPRRRWLPVLCDSLVAPRQRSQKSGAFSDLLKSRRYLWAFRCFLLAFVVVRELPEI